MIDDKIDQDSSAAIFALWFMITQGAKCGTTKLVYSLWPGWEPWNLFNLQLGLAISDTTC